MKKKNINLSEQDLMTQNEQTQIRGGGSDRIRTRQPNGDKIKYVLPKIN